MCSKQVREGKISQGFALHFCILQAIKKWMVGRPGNEATYYFLRQFSRYHVVGEIEGVQQLKMTKVFNLVGVVLVKETEGVRE